MVERLSVSDNSLLSSYAEHIQRYEFALPYCLGKRILDAGCGVGYGSHFLAKNGAKSVFAVDISDDALLEARVDYRLDNLTFERRDVERLNRSDAEVFDVVVNFENLEHLNNPQKFIEGAGGVLSPGGVLITSTPNGAISNVDALGKLSNEFHIKEFTSDELSALLVSEFNAVDLYGQWLTHAGKLRKLRARELFEQLSETYFNPMNRIGRFIKQIAGKSSLGPPRYAGGADSFEGDYAIKPLSSTSFSWEPTVLIAVCRKA